MPVINDGPKPAGSLGRVARRAQVRTEKGAGEGQKAAQAGAHVTLSSDVQLMDSVRRTLDALPDVDEARVAELKLAVSEGRYKPDLERVAEGLLEEAILGTDRRAG